MKFDVFYAKNIFDYILPVTYLYIVHKKTRTLTTESINRSFSGQQEAQALVESESVVALARGTRSKPELPVGYRKLGRKSSVSRFLQPHAVSQTPASVPEPGTKHS